MSDIKLCVIGGDNRNIIAAKELAAIGYEVALYGFDKFDGDFGEVTRCTDMDGAIRCSYAIILPLPFSKDNETLNAPFCSKKIKISEILNRMNKNQMLLGGKLSIDTAAMCKIIGIESYDYYLRDDFSLLNAIATAEGALEVAMSLSDVTLHGSKCAVISYGKVGKVLASKLRDLSADVTVAVRRESYFSEIYASGLKGILIPQFKKTLSDYDFIFNAAPSLVLDAESLKNARKTTVFVDLASMPGGIDREEAKKLGLKFEWALALPGKVAPVSAGVYLAKTINNIITGVE